MEERMRRGWEVLLNDGRKMNESKHHWRDVPKNSISCLSLLFDGRRWDFSGKEAYFVSNRASMIPGIKETFRIETRTVGYYEGAKKVLYTIDEFTGQLKISIKE